jgi:hypothetical protein
MKKGQLYVLGTYYMTLWLKRHQDHCHWIIMEDLHNKIQRTIVLKELKEVPISKKLGEVAKTNHGNYMEIICR